jgi:hypothetical protein
MKLSKKKLIEKRGWFDVKTGKWEIFTELQIGKVVDIIIRNAKDNELTTRLINYRIKEVKEEI